MKRAIYIAIEGIQEVAAPLLIEKSRKLCDSLQKEVKAFQDKIKILEQTNGKPSSKRKKAKRKKNDESPGTPERPKIQDEEFHSVGDQIPWSAKESADPERRNLRPKRPAIISSDDDAVVSGIPKSVRVISNERMSSPLPLFRPPLRGIPLRKLDSLSESPDVGPIGLLQRQPRRRLEPLPGTSPDT